MFHEFVKVSDKHKIAASIINAFLGIGDKLYAILGRFGLFVSDTFFSFSSIIRMMDEADNIMIRNLPEGVVTCPQKGYHFLC